MIPSSVIASVKKRDNSAFKTMYQGCIKYVYAIVKRYISNESDYQDVIQEIFARVFINIESFDESKGAFKFWLRRLVINQCMQYYRKQKPSGLIVSIDHFSEIEISIEEQLNELTKEEIESFLQRMPEGYRQIFMLVIIDDYSHKEVGELLNISAETSRSQLHRAKKWLRKHLFNNNHKILASGL